MRKNIKTTVAAGMALAITIPTFGFQVHAATDYIAEGKNSLTKVRPTSDVEMRFTSRDIDRQDWYEDRGKNAVYKTYKNGTYYYSPVRPRDVKVGTSNHQLLYENYMTKKMLNERAWQTRYMLVTTNTSSELYNQNFKTRAKSVSSVKSGRGGGFVPSKNVDSTGDFAGRYGEWRYLGYSDDGASNGNAFFPEDYTSNYTPLSHRYESKPWTKGGVPEMFAPGSSYDRATHGPLYQDKLNAVTKMLNQNPTMKNGKTLSQWMDILSLTSPVLNDTATFRAVWDVNRGAGETYRYVEYTLINDIEQKNLMVTRMEIINKETGDTVAVYTNNTPGKAKGDVSYRGDKVLYTQTAYDVKITVKNMNNTETKLSRSELDAGYKKNYSPGVAYPSDFKGTNGNEFKQTLYADKIPAKESKNFYLRDVLIPDDQADRMVMMNAIIGAEHRTETQDNLDTADDVGMIPISVKAKPGDMELEKIELIDENGQVVPQPIPGEKYRVRYTYKYVGGDIKYGVHYTETDEDGEEHTYFSHWVYPYVDVAVRSNIERKLPLGGTDYSQETISKSVQVHNGDVFKFETTDAVLYENPYVKATGDFDITESSYIRYNSGDDRGSKTWSRPYDYGIEDLQVVPRTERSATPGKMKVAVSFTATQDAPLEATRVGFQEDLDITVNVNGVTKTITEHVVEGKNRNIIVEMDVDAEPGDILNAQVEVNSSRDAWENAPSGNVYDNNAMATLGITNVISPTGSNYDNTNTSGYLSDFMLFPTDEEWVQNTSNEWVQEYKVRDFSGQRVSYNSKVGTDYTFTKYRGTPVSRNVEIPQEESYEIEKILFRSKFTKDNQMGEKKDGWVDMISSNEQSPRIKAGYGYELKVLVRYKTNALSTQPDKVDIPNFLNRNLRSGKGTSVRAYHVAPNIPEDIFVKVPGIDNPISVSGARGTLPKMEVKTSGTPENQLFEYTLKATADMGITQPGKLYVGENVKDGEYDIQVWTPQINGIPTKNMDDNDGKTVYVPSLLGDLQETVFEVKGSATDDLVDSIIQ